jgi:hypothetical protein
VIARLYSNENFPLPAVIALREFGHDVLTSHESGKANDAIPDSEVLELATQSGRAVLTHNRSDFMALHRKNEGHEGIIVCTANPDFSALAACIHKQLVALDSLKGLLVRVNKGG